MADTPFPLPRELRMTGILAGDGGNAYGPFSFKIFDVEDVAVFVRLYGETGFEIMAADVQKVGSASLAFFTIELPADLHSSDQFVVAGVRVGERSAAVKKGTQLDIAALEKELSKLVAQGQETRRDLDRAVLVDFGGDGLSIDPNLSDGDVLVKNGRRLSKGPSVSQLLGIGDQVAAFAAAAAGSATSAAAAAAQSGVYAGLAAVSAAGAAASQGQAQNLVDAAQAGYVGFQPGTFYDLGRVTDSLELFPGDLGRVSDL